MLQKTAGAAKSTKFVDQDFGLVPFRLQTGRIKHFHADYEKDETEREERRGTDMWEREKTERSRGGVVTRITI